MPNDSAVMADMSGKQIGAPKNTRPNDWEQDTGQTFAVKHVVQNYGKGTRKGTTFSGTGSK